MDIDQDSLFQPWDLRGIGYSVPVERLEISRDALLEWKRKVHAFQQGALGVTATFKQGSLFDAPPGIEEYAATINPFDLPRLNTEFWRWRAEDMGEPAYYFVLDDAIPLILYVGETVHSNQRWKGTHDCKRYLQNYVSAHRQHDLPVQVNTTFLRNAPQETRDRQRLELALINRFASPFNKEQWVRWSTPFTGGKKIGGP